MKKKLLVVMALLAFSGVTQAGWDFGGRFGGTLSSFSSSNTSYSGGYYAGGFVNYGFLSRFSACAEVDLAMQGVKHNRSSTYDQNFEQDMYYLHVPIVLDIKLGSGFSIKLGPQFGFLLAETASVQNIITESIDYNIFDFSLAVGMEFKIPTTPLKLQFRYAHGLTDISSSRLPEVDFSNAKNRSFQLGVALEF